MHTYSKEVAGGCFKVGGLKTRDQTWDPTDFDTVNDVDDEYNAAENAGDIKLLDGAIAAVQAAKLDYSDYPDDVDFLVIQDFSKQFQILQDKDGYLQPGLFTTRPVPGSIWAEKDGSVWADYHHRELKFDPKSMKANGWSNIQLGSIGAKSSDAESIILVPAKTGIPAKPYIYLAEVSTLRPLQITALSLTPLIGLQAQCLRFVDLPVHHGWRPHLPRPKSFDGSQDTATGKHQNDRRACERMRCTTVDSQARRC